MRTALALALAISVTATGATVWAQNAQAPAAAPAATCANPNALGVARVIEIGHHRRSRFRLRALQRPTTSCATRKSC